MAKIKVDLDGKTLHAAKDVAEQLGFDLESVTRAFYRQMVREQRIPLDLSLQAPVYTPLASVEEAVSTAKSEPVTAPAAKTEKPKKSEDAGASAKGKAAAGKPSESQKKATKKQPASAATEHKAPAAAAKPNTANQAAGKASDDAPSKASTSAASKPAPEIPPLSSIPSEDELMERMLAARDEEEEKHQIDEAVKRDAERKAQMQAEMDRAFEEAAAKRQAAAEREAQQEAQRQAAEQSIGFDHSGAASDNSADAGRKAPAADDDAQRLADAFAAVREEGKRKAEQMEHRRAGDDEAPQSGNTHSEQPLTIDKDGTKHGGWRDSWLFEDDDPNDELLFSPWEI